MPENNQSYSDSNKADSNNDHAAHDDALSKVFPAGLRRILLVGGISLIALLFISLFAPYMSERIKFFTVNALSLLVLLAIAVQAYIYQRQWEAMRESLTQNERAVSAAERSVQVAEEAFYIGQRAYVGIKRMEIANHVPGYYPTLTITWFNGGKTPAWRFRSIPQLILGEKPSPKKGFSWLEDDFSDISVSFIPAGEERTVKYSINDFLVTEEIYTAIESGLDKRLYALAEGSYLDIKGKSRRFRVWALYDRSNRGFVELEEEQADYYPNPN